MVLKTKSPTAVRIWISVSIIWVCFGQLYGNFGEEPHSSFHKCRFECRANFWVLVWLLQTRVRQCEGLARKNDPGTLAIWKQTSWCPKHAFIIWGFSQGVSPFFLKKYKVGCHNRRHHPTHILFWRSHQTSIWRASHMKIKRGTQPKIITLNLTKGPFSAGLIFEVFGKGPQLLRHRPIPIVTISEPISQRTCIEIPQSPQV